MLKKNEKTAMEKLSSIVDKFSFNSSFMDDIIFSNEDVEQPMSGLLDDDDDVFVYKGSKNLTEEQLSVLNINFTINDVFVERPFDRRKRRHKTQYSRQNYLINRILHLPTINILGVLNTYVNIFSSKTLNIADYIKTFEILLKKIDVIQKMDFLKKILKIYINMIWLCQCVTIFSVILILDYQKTKIIGLSFWTTKFCLIWMDK